MHVRQCRVRRLAGGRIPCVRESRHWIVGLLAFAGLCIGLVVFNTYLNAVLPKESAWVKWAGFAILIMGLLTRLMRRRS